MSSLELTKKQLNVCVPSKHLFKFKCILSLMKTIWIQWYFITQNVHMNQIVIYENTHLNIVEIELFPCRHLSFVLYNYTMQLCIQSARPMHSCFFTHKSVISSPSTSQVCVLPCTIIQAAIFYFSLLIWLNKPSTSCVCVSLLRFTICVAF